MKRRHFIVGSIAAGSLLMLPSYSKSASKAQKRLRTAHIGVGGMGAEDLKAIASHDRVDVVALCDVDSRSLEAAKEFYGSAKTFSDYRVMLREMASEIDAVVVSTPDHTHAPASLMAMDMNKAVYCQKPLTHYVSEARLMNKVAKEKNLVTQMGIQVHSFYDYKLATLLIQTGVIGKVSSVQAWSPKNLGYDGPVPKGSDPVPTYLDWNLWLGTAKERVYSEGIYHPFNWRKIIDYGCGTLGDMGVHIFDTPYNALALDVPRTITSQCRQPNSFGFPEKNTVKYEFPGTKYTTDTLTWHWYDGEGAPSAHPDLVLPNDDKLPDQGAMFIGEKGRLLLPHFMELPRLIVEGSYKDLPLSNIEGASNLGQPVQDYDKESLKHYHEFVNACLGEANCSAPFSYASRLTETILLGVIAGRFPERTLHWDSKNARFAEKEANKYLGGEYRTF